MSAIFMFSPKSSISVIALLSIIRVCRYLAKFEGYESEISVHQIRMFFLIIIKSYNLL